MVVIVVQMEVVVMEVAVIVMEVAIVITEVAVTVMKMVGHIINAVSCTHCTPWSLTPLAVCKTSQSLTHGGVRIKNV